ncbi:unnamed protein product [Triticum turgidum subsp. durum]|uniref:Uncharacterized protein n=1 Tax=Triticum turgidum subsp. durum TaxID=4567 RepID=A0A9R0TV39_TRITD|nr:unnamed protein product [Triticum turgidum subsp. durum]
MASQLVESHRAGAEVIKGGEVCKKKSVELLEELGLPKGLFPMGDIEEIGYNPLAGSCGCFRRRRVSTPSRRSSKPSPTTPR